LFIKNYYADLVAIFDKQKEQILNKVKKLLADKLTIEDLFYSKVLDGENESILLWQPLRSKVLSTISKLMQESYLFGQETALDELKIDETSILDKEGKSLIKDRSKILTDQFFNNIKYRVELVLTSFNSENKTSEDTINDIKSQFETIQNKNLVDIINSESMLFLNKGRAKIAQENI